MNFGQNVDTLCRQIIVSNEILYIGLSGGADSVALLHTLVCWRNTFSGSLKIHALHVHHNLSENADIWAQFCVNLCEKWAVPIDVLRVNVDKNHASLEAAARQARYQALAKHIGAGTIALAHHADDQVETVLLAVLRGGGLRALAAMPETRFSGSLKMIRPFLNVSRDEINQYIQTHQLKHIHDESNDNPDFLRNWVRHNLLPKMAERVPNVSQQILNSVAVLQDELSILNNVLEKNWQHIHHENILKRNVLQNLNLPEMKDVLLKFCFEKQLGSPTKHSLNDFAHYLHQNHSGTHIWSLPHGEIWAYRQKLFAWHNIQKKQYFKETEIFSGCLKNAPQLSWLPEKRGFSQDCLTQNAIVRPHQSGDEIHTPIGTKSVVKLLQDKKIPIPLREKWLVVAMRGKCVAVANIAVCESVAVENGWLPEWKLTLPFMN